MELLDVVDENNNFTGKKEDRKIVHEKGFWHREVAIIIINENNELLIQKRAATKKQAPNKWALTAGHIDAGEEPNEVAKRETLEEIGLALKDEEIEFLFISKIEKKFSDVQYNNYFNYVYLAKTNKKISEFVIQKEELSEVKYISIEKFENMINNYSDDNIFYNVDYLKKVIEILKQK